MSKKKSKEEFDKKVMVKAIVRFLTKRQMSKPFKSASIYNGNEQPIILISDEKFDVHTISFGKDNLTVPVKMIPYLVEALQNLYTKNGLDKFKGDQKALDKFTADNFDSKNIEYFDLNEADPDDAGCGDPNCPGCSGEHEDFSEALGDMQEQLARAFVNRTKFEELSDEDKEEVVEKLMESKEIAHNIMEEIAEGETSKEDLQRMKEESIQEIRNHIKDVENILIGKKMQNEEDIDLTHIKRVLEKYGPEAAKEEIRRCAPEKRDALLKAMLEYFNNKK